MHCIAGSYYLKYLLTFLSPPSFLLLIPLTLHYPSPPFPLLSLRSSPFLCTAFPPSFILSLPSIPFLPFTYRYYHYHCHHRYHHHHHHRHHHHYRYVTITLARPYSRAYLKPSIVPFNHVTSPHLTRWGVAALKLANETPSTAIP